MTRLATVSLFPLHPFTNAHTCEHNNYTLIFSSKLIDGFIVYFILTNLERGHIVMTISICCFILNSLVLRTILSRENHRRDNNQTKGLRLTQFMSEGHLNDLGDMHPNFRYTL